MADRLPPSQRAAGLVALVASVSMLAGCARVPAGLDGGVLGVTGTPAPTRVAAPPQPAPSASPEPIAAASLEASTPPSSGSPRSSPAPAASPSAVPGSAAPLVPSASSRASVTNASPPPSPSSTEPLARPSDGPERPARVEGPTASRRVTLALQAALDRMRAEAGIPGVSVTILFPDGTEWTGVSGLAEVRGEVPVTPDTGFAIASVSKTFLAALVLELVAEGVVGLDDPVAPHLPELRIDPAVTVRMLLDHTSGLEDYFLNPGIDTRLLAEPTAGWSVRRALSFAQRPRFPPGRGWHYSNTNYLILGALAEQLTGRPLAVELRTRFLDPLGLRSVFYQAVEEPRVPMAHGYRLTGTGDDLVAVDLADGTGVMPYRSVVTAAGGAGSLAATSVDVARWARALYAGAAIRPESRRLMLEGVDRVAGLRPRIPYGLGVQVLPVDRWLTLGHSGRFGGFRSVMRWLPEEQVAIAVLTNQSREEPGPIAARLLRIALPEPGRCPCREVR